MLSRFRSFGNCTCMIVREYAIQEYHFRSKEEVHSILEVQAADGSWAEMPDSPVSFCSAVEKDGHMAFCFAFALITHEISSQATVRYYVSKVTKRDLVFNLLKVAGDRLA